jgi:ZIP family zinc transporter
VGDLEELHKMAAQIVEYETRENHEWEGQAQSDKSERSDEGEGGEEVENNNDETQEDDRVSEDKEAEEQKALMRMSINTAVAIGLHNFPEGLATFVAALNDTRVGAVLAVAIAIHNIPEGLCVAMPVYYATGNRWKAFGWAVLSGVSEPIAALLGWAVLANSFSDDMYAILFGLVAGMMVIISVRELLPTAHRYDPEDTVVTYSFMVGMAIMAVSLVLFLI